MELDCELEGAHFGERLGTLDLYQISQQRFQLECLTSNLSSGDSTGLRAYPGCHVIIRLVAAHPEFVEQKNVVELGCGIGVFGLVGTHLSHPTLLVLTDREARGSSIVQKNIQHFDSLYHAPTPTFYQQLRWGDAEDTQKVLDLCVESPYDVVLGSELMYFNTDVDIMIQAVMSVTQGKGLFIHGHLFRAHGQLLAAHHWTTLEVPHKDFISAGEMKAHSEWYGVLPLISGPESVIAKLFAEHPSWQEFKEYHEPNEQQDDSEIFSTFQ